MGNASPLAHDPMRSFTLCAYLLFLDTVRIAAALRVAIDYSFPLPKQLGMGTRESENCCPYMTYPDNDIQSMVVPTVFGIGVQKGGTTTLYGRLTVHPQLLQPITKELHYFDSEGKASETYQAYLKRWAWNAGNLTETEAGKIAPSEGGRLFEITPAYVFVPVAACRMKSISPNAKIVVFLRDPVDRSLSGFSFTRNQKLSTVPDLGNWTNLDSWQHSYRGIVDIHNRQGCDFHSGKGQYSVNDCHGCIARLPHPVECYRLPFAMKMADGGHVSNSLGFTQLTRSMYAAQLAWWFTFFPPSQIHVVNSKEFFTEPLNVLQRIVSFLELDSPYLEDMLDQSPAQESKGEYPDEDEGMAATTRTVLREYFRRPNLELYRLLHETGYSDFEPFEKELAEFDSIDCRDKSVVNTGICGVDVVSRLDPDWRNVRLKRPDVEGTTPGLKQIQTKKRNSKRNGVLDGSYWLAITPGTEGLNRNRMRRTVEMVYVLGFSVFVCCAMMLLRKTSRR